MVSPSSGRDPAKTPLLTAISLTLPTPQHSVSDSESERRRTVWEHAQSVALSAYEKTKHVVAREYSKFKEDPKRGPRWLRISVLISIGVLFPALIVDLLWVAITLSVTEVLCDSYALIGCILIALSELARTSWGTSTIPVIQKTTVEDAVRRQAVVQIKTGVAGYLRKVTHRYFGFLEFCVGRGLLQMFVASLTITSIRNLLRFIPGVVLLTVGLTNIIYGIYAARKLNLLLATLKTEVLLAGTKEDSTSVLTMDEQLNLMERKFEALDKRGDGRVTKEDLREAIKELNFQLNELELDMIFEAIDKDNNGAVDKTEFESWWFKNKYIRFL